MTVHVSDRQHGRNGPQGAPLRRRRKEAPRSPTWRCDVCRKDNSRERDTCGTVGCPGTRPAGRTKAHGWNDAKRAWICSSCFAWHDRKPRGCINPACAAPRSGMLYFPSKGQGQRYMALYQRQRAGVVRGLQHHPEYALCCPTPDGGFATVGVYQADTTYEELTEQRDPDGQLPLAGARREVWVRVVEDFKPKAEEARDPKFLWKKAHFEAQYGIEIRVTTDPGE